MLGMRVMAHNSCVASARQCVGGAGIRQGGQSVPATACDALYLSVAVPAAVTKYATHHCKQPLIVLH